MAVVLSYVEFRENPIFFLYRAQIEIFPKNYRYKHLDKVGACASKMEEVTGSF